MNFIDAALSATYPVIVLLSVVAILRFIPVLPLVEAPTRTLICSQLTMTGGVAWEAALYGYGRFSGHYISIATNPGLVSIGKITFMVGLVYMLYAFWMLSVSKPKLIYPLTLAVVLWVMLTGALML